MSKTSPQIFNFFKPAGMTSYDVIRMFKKKNPRGTKLGHFGTLDPFASGVLMIGINGAQKLNNYIHDCLPKSYRAIGILGSETETGDLTEEITQKDDTDFFKNVVSTFSIEFIEEKLREKFLGDYWQAPHKYSAAKFEGKALHKWAREGVEIKKEKKLRNIYDIKVVSYEYPKLIIDFKVSSGTYIRTLFSECAAYLGTLGVLSELIRQEIGVCNISNAIREENWELDRFDSFKIDEVLPFSSLILATKEANLYSNGVRLKQDRALREVESSLKSQFRWVRDEENKILGLADISDNELNICLNFN